MCGTSDLMYQLLYRGSKEKNTTREVELGVARFSFLMLGFVMLTDDDGTAVVQFFVECECRVV